MLISIVTYRLNLCVIRLISCKYTVNLEGQFLCYFISRRGGGGHMFGPEFFFLSIFFNQTFLFKLFFLNLLDLA